MISARVSASSVFQGQADYAKLDDALIVLSAQKNFAAVVSGRLFHLQNFDVHTHTCDDLPP